MTAEEFLKNMKTTPKASKIEPFGDDIVKLRQAGASYSQILEFLRLNEVVVFDATWDFSSALRIATRRTDLAADVVSPRTRFVAPYKNQYVYRYDRDELVVLKGPPSPPLLIRDY